MHNLTRQNFENVKFFVKVLPSTNSFPGYRKWSAILGITRLKKRKSQITYACSSICFMVHKAK